MHADGFGYWTVGDKENVTLIPVIPGMASRALATSEALADASMGLEGTPLLCNKQRHHFGGKVSWIVKVDQDKLQQTSHRKYKTKVPVDAIHCTNWTVLTYRKNCSQHKQTFQSHCGITIWPVRSSAGRPRQDTAAQRIENLCIHNCTRSPSLYSHPIPNCMHIV